jgi:hypothetical protein
MTTLTVTLDDASGRDLQTLSQEEGIPAGEIAARLLRRALRSRRPRTPLDVAAVRAAAAELADDDAALAESDAAHRAELLAAEDAAE